MKIDITTLSGDAAGSIELDDAIFGLDLCEDLDRAHGSLSARQAPRLDTHKTKGRAEAPARNSTSRVLVCARAGWHALSVRSFAPTAHHRQQPRGLQTRLVGEGEGWRNYRW